MGGWAAIIIENRELAEECVLVTKSASNFWFQVISGSKNIVADVASWNAMQRLQGLRGS